MTEIISWLLKHLVLTKLGIGEEACGSDSLGNRRMLWERIYCLSLACKQTIKDTSVYTEKRSVPHFPGHPGHLVSMQHQVSQYCCIAHACHFPHYKRDCVGQTLWGHLSSQYTSYVSINHLKGSLSKSVSLKTSHMVPEDLFCYYPYFYFL